MTANSIIAHFIKMIFRDKINNFIFPNTYIGKYEADLLEITKSGYAYEYEVKISRSDFKNDAKKRPKSRPWQSPRKSKFEIIADGSRINYFYYIVPENLVSVDEVPEFAGLIYAKANKDGRVVFYTVKGAPRLSKEKIGDMIKQKCCISTYYKYHKLRAI